MSNNIGNESISSYWKRLDNYVNETLVQETLTHSIYNVDYNVKLKKCFIMAYRIEKRVDELILVGLMEKSKEYAALGIQYCDLAEMMGDRRTSLGKVELELANYWYKKFKYKFKWILEGKEDMELLKTSFDQLLNLAEEKKNKKKSRNIMSELLECVHVGIKIGEFEMAKKYLKEILNSKKSPKCTDIIYDEIHFIELILEALSVIEDNKELFNEIVTVYNKFFYELTMNTTLIRIYNISRLIDMSYIYFKYFDASNKNMTNPFKIINAVRYGLKGQ